MTGLAGSDVRAIQENGRIRRQQAELARFGLFALAQDNFGDVLAEATRVCAECFGVPYCTVYRYRNEKNDLIAEAGAGWNAGVIGRAVSPAENTSPQGRAFISRGPVSCGDLIEDTTFVRSSLYVDYGILATLNVIIVSTFHAFRIPYGVLAIDSPAQHHYDACDIDFLTGIASVLAQTIDSARRKDALRIADDRLQGMIDDRDRLLVTKNALLETKNLLLEERTLFTRDVLHRVRSNFQLIYGMLNDQLQIATDAVQTRSISGIARRVMSLAQIHDDLLTTGLSQTIDFGVFLPSLCSSFEVLDFAQHPNVKLQCHCERVELDLDSVTAVALAISELIQNSYAHAFPDGKGLISLALSMGQSGENATIVFADNGVDVLEPDGDSIRGLGFVNRLMEQLGGTATHHSDHGSQWVLKFPTQTISIAGEPAAGG